MEDVIFILAVIMFIIAVFALYWQISRWKIQRVLLKEKRDSTQDNDKSDDKRLRQSVLLSVSISLTVIALGLQIHSWFMQYDEYEKKRDGEKRSEQMDSDYLAFQNKESLSTDIKPDFKVDVKNFDMVINASIGEKAEDDLSAMIWRYEPGKYVLSQTPEGRAILGTIELQMDEVLKKNRNKDENKVKIIVEAIGSADALPYRKYVYYDGLLGDVLRDIRYYRYNEPNTPLSKTFIKGETLITNSEIALLRAWDAVKYLDNKYKIKSKYIKIQTREFEQTGPEYRRLDLEITLKKTPPAVEKKNLNIKTKLNNNE